MSRNLNNVMRLINEVNKTTDIADQFLNDLKYSIEKQANKEQYKPSQTFKPSSFNCLRNAYFQLIGAELDNDTTTYNIQGICDSGTDAHIRIQKALQQMKENGIDLEYVDVEEFIKNRNLTDLEIKDKKEIETKLYNKKYNMSFMTDGIIKYKSKYFIFEFKTETADKFYKRTGVDEKHYNQAIMYAINFHLDKVIFLYQNRNTMDLKAYLFEVTEEMKQDILNKIGIVNQAVTDKIPPKKDENLLKNQCNYCSYKTICKRSE